jgi:hypothetical protein
MYIQCSIGNTEWGQERCRYTEFTIRVKVIMMYIQWSIGNTEWGQERCRYTDVHVTHSEE